MTASRNDFPLKLANGLGWFSIALGVTELVAAGTLARTLGMNGQETVIRAFGVREIVTGLGLLATTNKAAFMWGRVGGDALDLATLGSAFNDGNPQKNHVGLALAAVAGVTALDGYCAQALSGGLISGSTEDGRKASDLVTLPMTSRDREARQNIEEDLPTVS